MVNLTLVRLALATAFGGVGEIPSAIIQAQRLSKGAAGLLPDVTQSQATQAKEVAERTGVSLLPSQTSKTDKDQLVNFLLFQDPASSKAMKGRLQTQSKEVFDGAFTFLDELAKTDEASRAALDVRNLSQKAITEASKNRTKQTSPIFTQAFNEAEDAATRIDMTPTLQNIDGLIRKSTGRTRTQLVKLRRDVAQAMNSEGKSNVEMLHNVKRELRDEVKLLTKGSDPKMSKFVAGNYNDAAEEINGLIRQNSDTYSQANDLFIEMTPPVERLQGNVGNIADVPDDALRKVATDVFNVQEFSANPQRFFNTKDIIQTANPEAWDALVKNRFQQDLVELGIETIEEATDPDVNFIQKMWQKSFTGKEKTLFKNSLDGEMKKNYVALADVFNQTRKRPAQSATQQLVELRDAIDGKKGVAKAIEALNNRSASGLFRALTGADQAAEKNMTILADVITDPKWMDRMTEIRRLGMESPKGGAAFIQLFRDAYGEENQLPQDRRGTQ